jgi:AraC-like DNA-binding protein
MQKISEVVPNDLFVDLIPYHYGYEECEPLHSFGPTRREHFLFHYILSGRGKFLFVNDKGKEIEYSLRSGQGFLIWPQQQSFYIADEKEPWVYAWISFDGQKARELMVQAGLSYNDPVYISKNSEEHEKMKSHLMAIVREKDSLPVTIIGHLYLFIGALIDTSASRKQPGGWGLRDYYIRECLSFIEQHYQEEIGVEDIAACCCLNRGYLAKIFRAVLNTSPHEFLIRYRINKSCELMKTTDLSINEISEMVGYPNQFNFSRVFKEIAGSSPRDWRKEHKIQEA